MRLCFLVMELCHRRNRLKDVLLAILRELVVLFSIASRHLYLIRETDSIATGVFGRIHGSVCHVKQLSGYEPIKGVGRQAKTGREGDAYHQLRLRSLPQTWYLSDGAPQAFGQVERLRLFDVREQDGELFAPIPTDAVVLADPLAQPLPHLV